VKEVTVAWHAIEYVTGGLTLIAFVAVAILVAYRTRLKTRLKIISTASKEDLPKVLAIEKQFFPVDTKHLLPEQAKEVIIEQVRSSERQNAKFLQTALYFAIILGVITIVALFLSRGGGGPPSDGDATWTRNYALIGPFKWAPLPTNPSDGTTVNLSRPDFQRRLAALILDDEPTLKLKRDALARLVHDAPELDKANPSQIQITPDIDSAFRDLKNTTRDVASKHHVNVEQIDKDAPATP
jgi:hypothetical protein